jgi:Mn2+/Fe2+ NRAMP family transporter
MPFWAHICILPIIIQGNHIIMEQSVRASSSIWKAVGPGILMAGAAIGVSHLVQATRAGADYGLTLLPLLILACISKYPFMEFGPRYAAATNEHLIAGYRRLGKGYYAIFTLITIGTMFIVQAAVTIVTAGLAEQFFNFGWTNFQWSCAILGLCLGLLLLGRYPWLDITMKIIISLLTISTLFAVAMAFRSDRLSEVALVEAPSFWNSAGIAFVISMMGWMPIPIDASVWHSIWVKERAKQSHHLPTIRESKFDFNLGYISAGFIGVLFFLMGYLVMFGSGISFSQGSVGFSGQLVDLYGKTLGEWTRPLIAIAALITMISTTLAVSDAYPRIMVELWKFDTRKEVINLEDSHSHKWFQYQYLAPIIACVSLFVLYYFTSNFTKLVDFATALSFLAAPILAWFNLKLLTSDATPFENRPKGNYLIFAWSCLIFLVLFSLVFIYWTVIAR